MKRFIVAMFTSVLFMIFQPTMANDMGISSLGGETVTPVMFTLDRTTDVPETIVMDFSGAADQTIDNYRTLALRDLTRCQRCARTYIVSADEQPWLNRIAWRKHRSDPG